MGNANVPSSLLEQHVIRKVSEQCILFSISENACFLFLTTHTKEKQTNKQTHTGTYNTQQMHIFVQYWRIIDIDTKILKVIPCTSSDKIFNLTLKFKLDLTIFVQILEVSPQFQRNTVHIVTALIVHIRFQWYLSPFLCVCLIYFLNNAHPYPYAARG